MNTNVTEIFSMRLKKLRKENRLSQNELAEKLNISRGSLAHYEKATRMPGIDVLNEIARYFNCSADYLLGISEAKTQSLEIKDIVKRMGLSQKAVEALYYREIFDDRGRKILSFLLESEFLPPYEEIPQEIKFEEFENEETQDKLKKLLGGSRFAPKHEFVPLLTALIDCMNINDEDEEMVNINNVSDVVFNDRKSPAISINIQRGLYLDSLLSLRLQTMIRKSREILNSIDDD